MDKEDKDSVRNNANEVHKVNCFRKARDFFRNRGNLFRKVILRKVHFEILELMRYSLGRLSVVSRWREARYKRHKRDCNLNKTHFFRFRVLSRFLGSSLVYPWFILGFLRGRDRQGTREGNLKKQPYLTYCKGIV